MMNPNILTESVEKIFEIIENPQNICVAGHKAPDGDCIGSVMALYEFLKVLNKDVTICIEGDIPYNYKYFVDDVDIKSSVDEIHDKINDFDVLFVLDCGDEKRLGEFQYLLNKTKLCVCIDHHQTNTYFGDVNIVDEHISSTGELLYDILTYQNDKLTKKIAEFIYIAMLTDTGKFSYQSTSAKTHKIAAKLIDLGIKVSEIDNIIYNSKPANIVKAYIECISQIELFYNNKLGIAYIKEKDLEKNNAKISDVDGVVEFIREIKEVEISAVLKEFKNNIKVSLRSKNDIDVSEISKNYNGGGHKKAAGFELYCTLEEAKNTIVKEFGKYFGEI